MAFILKKLTYLTGLASILSWVMALQLASQHALSLLFGQLPKPYFDIPGQQPWCSYGWPHLHYMNMTKLKIKNKVSPKLGNEYKGAFYFFYILMIILMV
jgi:hypothetical protein